MECASHIETKKEHLNGKFSIEIIYRLKIQTLENRTKLLYGLKLKTKQAVEKKTKDTLNFDNFETL